MTVKISGENYATCSFIIPCLISLQVAMEALCENDEIQIASALKRSVNFFIDEYIINFLNQEFKEYENIDFRY